MWLVLLASVLVAVAFLVVYPIANTHAAGAGSDDDDALNLGAMALLAGRFPYAHTTYLGNVLHHLPGAFILATPFVALGTSALQNLFWLPIFFLAVREDANSRTALRAGVGRPRAQPRGRVRSGHWHRLSPTRDLRAARLVVARANDASGRRRHRLGADAGVTRQLPLARAAGVRLPPSTRRVREPRLRAMALTCGTAAALTLPFYLHDPRHFGPLEARESPARLQSAPSTSGHCADRPDGGCLPSASRSCQWIGRHYSGTARSFRRFR